MTIMPLPLDWTAAATDERIRSARVLVADAEPVYTAAVQMVLQQFGFRTVLAVHDARQVQDAVNESRPDVILLTAQIGDVSGLDVLQQLRQEPQTADTPILLLAVVADPETRQQAIELGADDLINKPLDPRELGPQIYNLLLIGALQGSVESEFADSEASKRVAETSAKSEFLARMSHQIRTPMTSILGFAELLLNDPAVDKNNTQLRGAVTTIQRNGEFLLEFMNEIVDLSKIETRRLEVEASPTSVFKLVSEVVRRLRILANGTKLKLNVQYENPIPETITTDPTRLRQVLINLIGNAVQADVNGTIRLAVRYEADDVNPLIRFDVIDAGPKMAPEQIERVFEPFAETTDAGTVLGQCTGLGLTISRSIVQLLGGDLTMQNGTDGGNVLTATISTGCIDNVPLVTAPIADDTLTKEPNSQPSSEALSGTRVLLAEDGPDNRRLVTFMLERAGIDVTVANDGQQAVDAVLAAAAVGDTFNMILMDMEMPVLDGYQATRRLRDEGVSIPIVALTAYAMSKDREKCLEAGCDDYMTKPINRKQLLDLVQRNGVSVGDS